MARRSASSGASRRSTIGCTRRRIATTSRCSASSRRPTATSLARCCAAVEAWARARGRAAVRGPISPSLNEMCGLLVDGFDTDPMLLMPHNPPEYQAADRSGRLCEGEGSVRVDARSAPRRCRRRSSRAARAAARQARDHHPAAEPRRVHPRGRTAARASTAARGSGTGASCAPTAAEFRRIATELKPIFDPALHRLRGGRRQRWSRASSPCPTSTRR